MLAGLHRAGELTAVAVPSPSQEAVRDLCRTRGDMVEDLTQARSFDDLPKAAQAYVEHLEELGGIRVSAVSGDRDAMRAAAYGETSRQASIALRGA